MKATKIIGVILISPLILIAFLFCGLGYLICEGLDFFGIEKND